MPAQKTLFREPDQRVLNEGVRLLRTFPCIKKVSIESGPSLDAVIAVKADCGTIKYIAEVKPRLSKSVLPLLIHQFAIHKPPVLLITDYVSSNVAEDLRAQGIEFIDSNGNAYLNQTGLYIWVVGKRPDRKPLRPVRAFRSAGLKLIYVLLRKPEFLNSTHRDLASHAGISLGAVPVILEDLHKNGYFAWHKSQRIFQNTETLLKRWEQAYVESLRPKLYRESCRPTGVDNIAELLPRLAEDQRILIGGELAASLLTNQLRPETATLHSKDDVRRLMVKLRLLPDPFGPIKILQTFGADNASDIPVGKYHVADPLLIHAELIQIPGTRIEHISQLLLQEKILPRLQ